MKHAPKKVQLTMCLKDPTGIVELSEWKQDFEVNTAYDPHNDAWFSYLHGHIQFIVPEDVLLLALEDEENEELEDEDFEEVLKGEINVGDVFELQFQSLTVRIVESIEGKLFRCDILDPIERSVKKSDYYVAKWEIDRFGKRV